MDQVVAYNTTTSSTSPCTACTTSSDDGDGSEPPDSSASRDSICEVLNDRNLFQYIQLFNQGRALNQWNDGDQVIANHLWYVLVQRLHCLTFTEISFEIIFKRNDVGLLQYLINEGRAIPCKKAIEIAAECGHLEVLQVYAHTKLVPVCSTDAVDLAAEHGHLQVLHFLYLYFNGQCSSWAMDTAAMNGHIHILKYLHYYTTDAKATTDAIDFAAEHGHLEIVQWLFQHRQSGCSSNAIDGAAANGHLAIVAYLTLYHYTDCTPSAMDNAARNGHLNVLEWLHFNRTEGCTAWAMNWAAESGNLDIVKWLLRYRNENNLSQAIDIAALSQQFGIVKYLSNMMQLLGMEDETFNTYQQKTVSNLKESTTYLESYCLKYAGDCNGHHWNVHQSTPTPSFV